MHSITTAIATLATFSEAAVHDAPCQPINGSSQASADLKPIRSNMPILLSWHHNLCVAPHASCTGHPL
ncbi:hypothetical protein WJX74_007484 [Apatococcus lobatus]|uniref:Uncharacterized protein n=1 Tax=Apatococcus lobatus TaxID=904363 RepID=A0AAW1RLX9_9CHLO